MKKFVIAIDGPAASGKSTTARLAAQKLGYLYIDTGAMYRAMTVKVLEHRLDLRDEAGIVALAEETRIELRQHENSLKVFLDHRDVTRSIRSQEVTKAVSAVSAIRKVREVMVREQRRIAKDGGVILEGRDIGTVVFPDADLKIFMKASVEKRAMRRRKELALESMEVPLEDLVSDIRERDRKDSEREVSPLRLASDAVVMDTSDMTIEEQVEFIVNRIKEIQMGQHERLR